MNDTIVTLKKGEGRTLKSGGMWVYDNDLTAISWVMALSIQNQKLQSAFCPGKKSIRWIRL